MNASVPINSSTMASSIAASNCIEKWTWFIDMLEIQPGKSAIIGGNKLVFYGIHITALIFICISLTSCTLVIYSIYHNSKTNWDFSDRFPLYLAISDGLWALINLSGDHIVLLIGQVFPEKRVATFLGINVFIFFGYQQLMSAGLALFTYMKVVRRINLKLGSWEWKLHAAVVVFLLINVAFYYYVDAFGNSGYAFLADMNHPWGRLMAINISVTCTIHALLTLLAYRAIQNVITKQKRGFSMHIIPTETKESSKNLDCKLSKDNLENERRLAKRLSYTCTATKCLTTLVYISVCLYIPFAIVGWIFTVFGFYGVIEPLNALAAVIAANSGGWVNAVGYAYNRKIKEKRRVLMKNHFKATLCVISGSSNFK